MQVKLDDIELVKRVQPTATAPLSEVRTVEEVRVDGRRSVVELRIPGSSGNVLQDMGREPITIMLRGDVWGPDAKDTVESIKNKSDSGDSLDFTSDLLAASSVSKVVIEQFDVDQIAGEGARYRYVMLLREYKEPVEPTPADEVESEGTEEEEAAAEESQEEATDEAIKESEIHDVRVQLRDHKGDPVREVDVTIEGPDGKYESKTDEEGYVVVHDAKEGKYTISVNEDRFGEVKVEVEVKKGDDSGGEGGEGGGEE